MKTPYFRIYIKKSDRDISGYIEAFKFEDCIKEDSLVTLDVNRDYARFLADDEDFVTGTIISFQFGYLGGSTSTIHSARMTDLEWVYDEKVTMKIKCLDLGTVAKKDESQRIWKGKTSTQIAQEIASKYGLTAEVDATSKVWDSMPQGNKSDMLFLKYLADREEDGNYITYIRNNTLYFKKRGLEKQSAITYTYNEGNGPVLSFKPSVKESSAKGAMNKTTITGGVTVTPETEKKGGTTGAFRKYYGENGVEKGRGISASVTVNATIKHDESPSVNSHIIDPSKDKALNTNLANSQKKKSTLGGTTAKLELEGNPALTPDKILTMKNVAKRHEGNWWMDKVTHDIGKSGYKTTVDMNKNGGKKIGTTTKASDPNTSVGDKKLKQSVSVRVYSGENGAFQGYASRLEDVKK